MAAPGRQPATQLGTAAGRLNPSSRFAADPRADSRNGSKQTLPSTLTVIMLQAQTMARGVAFPPASPGRHAADLSRRLEE